MPAITPKSPLSGRAMGVLLRDDGIVPPIRPTCQNVFAGFAQSIHASDTTLLCMGLFSIFWSGVRTTSAQPCRCRSPAPPAHPDDPEGRRAEPDQSAQRMPLPHQVSVRVRSLPDGGAGAPVDRGQSVGGVSSRSAAGRAGPAACPSCRRSRVLRAANARMIGALYLDGARCGDVLARFERHSC